MLGQFYSGRILDIFVLLEGVAHLSDAKFKMASAIIKGGKVLGFGPNKMNRGFKAIHDKYPWPVEHCELAAIRGALIRHGIKLNGDIPLGEAMTICRGATIYIFRQWKNGHPALARPCFYCQRGLIKPLGFKKMIYTISEPPYFMEEIIE